MWRETLRKTWRQKICCLIYATQSSRRITICTWSMSRPWTKNANFVNSLLMNVSKRWPLSMTTWINKSRKGSPKLKRTISWDAISMKQSTGSKKKKLSTRPRWKTISKRWRSSKLKSKALLKKELSKRSRKLTRTRRSSKPLAPTFKLSQTK